MPVVSAWCVVATLVSQVLGVEAVLADGNVTSHLGGSTQRFGWI